MDFHHIAVNPSEPDELRTLLLKDLVDTAENLETAYASAERAHLIAMLTVVSSQVEAGLVNAHEARSIVRMYVTLHIGALKLDMSPESLSKLTREYQSFSPQISELGKARDRLYSEATSRLRPQPNRWPRLQKGARWFGDQVRRTSSQLLGWMRRLRS